MHARRPALPRPALASRGLLRRRRGVQRRCLRPTARRRPDNARRWPVAKPSSRLSIPCACERSQRAARNRRQSVRRRALLLAVQALLLCGLRGDGGARLRRHRRLPALRKELPPTPDLTTYASTAPGMTTFWGQDGTLLAELSTERREIVPLDHVPPTLVDAFCRRKIAASFRTAARSARPVRAFATNLRAGSVNRAVRPSRSRWPRRSSRRSAPGRARSRSRSSRAASRRNIRSARSCRSISTIFSSATAPSACSGRAQILRQGRRRARPRTAGADRRAGAGAVALLAVRRRGGGLQAAQRVLDNMVENGTLSRADADKWKQAPLHLTQRRDYFHEVTPYFTEQVRRDWSRSSAQRASTKAATASRPRSCRTSTSSPQDNVDHATRKLDKRQGWRGPDARLDDAKPADFRKRAVELYGEGPLVEGKLYLGLVEKVAAQGAEVRVGGKVYLLPVENMLWAAPYSASDATNDKQITAANEALHKYDVIWVSWDFIRASRASPTSSTTSRAKRPGSPSSSSPRSSRSRRCSRSSRRRVSRDRSTLRSPRRLCAGDGRWRRLRSLRVQPRDAGVPPAGLGVQAHLLLARARSRLRLRHDVERQAQGRDRSGRPASCGSRRTSTAATTRRCRSSARWCGRRIRPRSRSSTSSAPRPSRTGRSRLGITTPLITNSKCDKEFCSSLALGASCVHMDDMTRAFAIFARNGIAAEPVSVRRVIDRAGHVVHDNSAGTILARRRRPARSRPPRRRGSEPKPAIEPRTAYLTSKLLREIVTAGHSAPIRATKVHRRRQDRHLEPHQRRLVHRLHLALDGDRLARRRQLRAPARLQGRVVHAVVPMWARFMYSAVGRSAARGDSLGASAGRGEYDIGGPLKTDFPPPPPPGFDVTGKPIEPPDTLKEQLQKQQLSPVGTRRPILVRQRTVRVQSAVKPDAPRSRRPRASRAEGPPPRAAVEGARRRSRPRSTRTRRFSCTPCYRRPVKWAALILLLSRRCVVVRPGLTRSCHPRRPALTTATTKRHLAYDRIGHPAGSC